MNLPLVPRRLALLRRRPADLSLPGRPVEPAQSWNLTPAGLVLVCLFILGMLFIPLGTLLYRAGPGWSSGLWLTPTVGAALRLSLVTATLTTFLAVLFGGPVAYVLARYQFFGLKLLDVVIDLPMVLPPAVAGIALLVTFGRHGLFGQYLAAVGIELPFTTAAVVLAQLFVAAPFFMRAAKAGFAEVDPNLEQIAASLGAGRLKTFWYITLPLARPALSGGAIMAWARAIGEFGATIIFAGNFSGHTQTLPLAIYTALQTDLNLALTLAAILLGTSFCLLALLRIATRC